MNLLEKYPPPWGWEYDPDTGRPIALSSTNTGGDVLLATGDESESWLVASEEVMRAMRELPSLLATGDESESWLVASEEVMRAMRELPSLLAFAKDFIELFRSSDMSPEDECHELYARAKEIIRNVAIGRNEDL